MRSAGAPTFVYRGGDRGGPPSGHSVGAAHVSSVAAELGAWAEAHGLRDDGGLFDKHDAAVGDTEIAPRRRLEAPEPARPSIAALPEAISASAATAR